MSRKVPLRGCALLASAVRIFRTSQPMTRLEFAHALGVHASAGANVVDDLAATGWIVCTFDHDRLANKYGCADRFDGHMPKFVEARTLAKKFRELYDALDAGPYTLAELSELTGRDPHCVRRSINAMHAHKLVHVSGWEHPKGPGKRARIYSTGAGKDAAPVVNVSRAAVQKKYNDRRAHRKLIARMVGPVPSVAQGVRA
jgi:predicted ArsR family transcriptional regulator